MRSRPLIATLSDQELDTWIRNATLTAEYAINEKSGE
jgi:hypothetical protein